jgi:hypothetical protein
MAAPQHMPFRGHRTSPTFSPDQPRELRRYFQELNNLFTDCQVVDDQAKKSYACRYLDVDSAELWESLLEYQATSTYVQFFEAVYKLYPGSEDERKWSITDMDKLVGEQLRIGIYDANDLGNYYRAFFAITQFLRTKNRLSEAEQSRAFVRGFQPDLWNRIARRLELKFPDHFPDDPYPLFDIHTAAQFVLHGTIPATFNLRTSTSTTAAATSSTSTATGPAIKAEDFTSFLDKFASTLIKALVPLQPSSTPSHNPLTISNPSNPSNACIFCGLTDHYISDCLVCQQYVTDGKCKKNAEDKIVLPNGQFCPRSIPGRWIKERIDEWHKRNPSTAAHMLYGISTSHITSQASPHPILVSQILPVSSAEEDRIKELERELFALRSGRKLSPGIVYRSTEEPDISSLPKDLLLPPVVMVPPTPASSGTSKISKASKSSESTQVFPVKNIEPPIHSSAYTPPHERNFAGKFKESPAYHSQIPIYSPASANNVYIRSMKSPCVTLTPEELLSISPDVRTKLRDAITPKRTPVDQVGTSTHVLSKEHPNSDTPGISNDFFESYSNSRHADKMPQKLVIAKELHALRSVLVQAIDPNFVEEVIDPGSKNIAISTNIDQSPVLSHNISSTIGTISIILAIQAIHAPVYNLIDRPFDIPTHSQVENFVNKGPPQLLRTALDNSAFVVEAYAPLPSTFEPSNLVRSYLSACEILLPISYPHAPPLDFSALKTKFRMIPKTLIDSSFSMPNIDPPPFTPTLRYLRQGCDIFDEKLEDIPVVHCTSWVRNNLPIPPGIFKNVCAITKQKIEAGVYGPSKLSCFSPCFCILPKKVPPLLDRLTEYFSGQDYSAILHLYVGYTRKFIAKSSHNLTTFETLFEALRLVALPLLL